MITVDGIQYRVTVVPDTLKRVAQLIEGRNASDMMSGRHERDLMGTRIPYEMRIEPDWVNYADYDALFDALAQPADSHIVTVPYGQTTLTFAAMIQTVSDGLIGEANGINRWHGMQVSFQPITPQKVVAT